jgi:hypothetical protein
LALGRNNHSREVSMSEAHSGNRRLTTAEAEHVLTRAAVLDARQSGQSIEVAALRHAATAAGIAAAAFDAALSELPAVTPAQDAPAVPWIVRVTLLGVPNRAVAWGYYAFFTAALLASFVAVIAVAVQMPRAAATYALAACGLAIWALFALWSTSKAIRWADTHGWARLP